MEFKIAFTTKATEDIEYFKASGNKSTLKKIFNLVQELQVHPEKGTGKPEKLKFELRGYWSRRINW